MAYRFGAPLQDFSLAAGIILVKCCLAGEQNGVSLRPGIVLVVMRGQVDNDQRRYNALLRTDS